MAITGTNDLGNSGPLVATVDHDPLTVATDVPKGSLIIDDNGNIWRKLDDGATTNIISGAGSPSGTFDGCRTLITGATTCSIGDSVGSDPSTVRAADNTSEITFNGAITGDLATNIDTGGAPAIDTFYHWYLTWDRADPVGNRQLGFSLSSSLAGFTFTGGRNTGRRVGGGTTTAAGIWDTQFQVGTGRDRYVHYISSILSHSVLLGGNGGFTPVSLAPYVPDTASIVLFTTNMTNALAGEAWFIRPTGSLNPIPGIAQRLAFAPTLGGGFATPTVLCPLLTNSIDFLTSAGVFLDIFVVGYWDSF